MVEKNGDFFVDPILAVHDASFLSDKLYHEILYFYVHAEDTRIK